MIPLADGIYTAEQASREPLTVEERKAWDGEVQS